MDSFVIVNEGVCAKFFVNSASFFTKKIHDKLSFKSSFYDNSKESHYICRKETKKNEQSICNKRVCVADLFLRPREGINLTIPRKG